MKNFLFDSRFSKTLYKCFCLQLLFWFAFYPGLYSKDSFEVLNMAKSGDISNAHTLQWAYYVKFLSLNGQYPQIVTLISSLLFIYSIVDFSFAIFKEKLASVISIIFCFTPIVWGMALNFWHDIPFTAGLILISSAFIKLAKDINPLKSSEVTKLVFGSFLITFRPNGLPTLLLALTAYLILRSSKVQRTLALISLFVGLISIILFSLFITNKSPINKISNYFEKYLNEIGSESDWSSEYACNFLNSAKITSLNNYNQINKIPSVWFNLLKNDPVFIISTHINRHAYLLPIPINGLPNPPFIHSNIEINELKIGWVFPEVAEKLRNMMRLYNYFNGITGWVGLWSLIGTIIIICQRKYNQLIVCSIAYAAIILLFIFAPIPDARYGLFNLITGQLLFLGWLINRIMRYENFRS